VGIPVGLAIMACGGQNVIVDRANAIVTMAGGKKITCIKKLVPGGQVFLAGKDGTIERPATPDEVAAVQLVMAKVAELEGSPTTTTTTATTTTEGSGGVLGKITDTLTGKMDGSTSPSTTDGTSSTQTTQGAGDATTAAKASDATATTASSSDPHPTSGATTRTIRTAVLGVVIATIIFFAT